MSTYILRAEQTAAIMAWLIVTILRLVILPIHLVAMLIERGCFEFIRYTTELQNATVDKLKQGK